MTKTAERTPSKQAGYTLGRKGFAKISSVEGIHLSSEMEERIREFDRKGLSPSERRREIARTLGKTR